MRSILNSQVFALVLWLAAAATTLSAERSPGVRLVEAARQQIGVTTEYDPSYTQLNYPGGDVPVRTGVCSDVVVRAFRTIGIDLQKEVHEDMQKNFSAYPKKWGLKAPDRNIDHRRVPNLMRYFERHPTSFELRTTSQEAEGYRAGDIVAWNLGGGVTHIGIVSDRKSGDRPLVIHNIGRGTAQEDILFSYTVIGHYRVRPTPARDR